MLTRRWPSSLLGRTTLVIASVATVFQIFAVATVALLAMVPQGKRARDDFAALLVESAGAWASLDAHERDEATRDLWDRHGIGVQSTAERTVPLHTIMPYYHFLESAIARRTGHSGALSTSKDETGRTWVWATVPTPSGPVFVRFARDRHAAYPRIVLAILFTLTVGTVAAFITSALFARHLTSPLRRLSTAVRRVGEGKQPEPVPEIGPDEFVSCVRSFNRMSAQVQELLAARTTLLAGISHDLKTPLVARMRLALGMLSDRSDRPLVNQLIADVDAMTSLINRCLEIGHGFEEPPAPADLTEVVRGAAAELGKDAGQIQIDAPPTCPATVRSLALRRVLINLLENAVRYGEGKPVDLTLDCQRLEIRIADRGHGIPDHERAAVFRPFYRVEPSRCSATGGSGLGLAIVRQLTDVNGWHVALIDREGGGTVAVLSLAE